MPANPKYLNPSIGQRFAKITAGFIGGYFLSVAFHMALATWWNRSGVVVSGYFSIYTLWAGLFIVAFLFRNGWKAWLLYLLMVVLFSLITYYGKMHLAGIT